MKAAAAFVLLMLAGHPAQADDGAAIDQLLNFIANGCVRSVVDGDSLSAFAKKEGARMTDTATARTYLGTDKGSVYLKDAMALADHGGDVCTVHTRFPGDLGPVTEAADDFFIGPGSRYFPGRVFEEASAHGGWVTHRVYLGQRAGKQITILFSTDPKAPKLDQVIVTVAAANKP